MILPSIPAPTTRASIWMLSESGQFRIPGDGNRKLTPREHGIPNFGGLPFTLQEQTSGNGYDNMDTYQPSAHLHLDQGKHTIKTGAEYYRISMERGAANIEEGQLNFANQTCGYAFACFLLGRPANTQTPEGIPLTFPRANRWGAYINDDFKVNSRLTVNLGLRLDYNGWGTDAQGLWRTLDIPGVGADIDRGAGYKLPNGNVIPTIFPAFSAKRRQETDQAAAPLLYASHWDRVSPNREDRDSYGRWLVRQHPAPEHVHDLQSDAAESREPGISDVVCCSAIRAVNAVNGQTVNLQTFRYAPNSPVLTLNDPFLTSTGGASVVRPIDVVYLPPDYKDGDVWKWSFDVQRELPWNVIAGVGYAGSKASHIGNSVINWNDPVSPGLSVLPESAALSAILRPGSSGPRGPVNGPNTLYRFVRGRLLPRPAGQV